MNPIKEQIRKENSIALSKAGICWESYNNDTHFRFGQVDFYPTTGKWYDKETDKSGDCVEDLIAHIRRPRKAPVAMVLSVEQLFEIAKGSKVKSLMGICEAIHRGVYGVSKKV